ncbi:doublecortin domain-containing protein 1 [Rhinoderma darwinii]|uniref:doublecortin domain-containing protein 1 n=1 Tax=Rhinoderma darwinii TaxID=43563 RepID=UPI003F67E547
MRKMGVGVQYCILGERNNSGHLWGFGIRGSIFPKQLSQPLAGQPLPVGDPREVKQLTVALVRILEEKHPKASAQRDDDPGGSHKIFFLYRFFLELVPCESRTGKGNCAY